MYYLFCYQQSAIFKGQSYNEACHYVLNTVALNFFTCLLQYDYVKQVKLYVYV